MSSPNNPASNGQVEATPIKAAGVSRSELMMGWLITTTIPALPRTLEPKWPDNQADMADDELME